MKSSTLICFIGFLCCSSLSTCQSQSASSQQNDLIAHYYYQKIHHQHTEDTELDSLINYTVSQLSSCPLKNKDMAFLSQELSVDFATLFFCEEVLKNKQNKKAQEIYTYYDNHEVQQVESNRSELQQKKEEYILVFVPGLFYKRHPENGGDFLAQRTQLDTLGFSTYLIRTNETGTIEENATFITSELRNILRKNKKIILVSASKGSPDLHYSIGHLLHKEEIKNVKAWISIGGILKGSPIADKYLKGFRKAYAKTLLFFIGEKINFVEDLGTKNTEKRLERIELPDHILTIHYVGAPLEQHLEKAVKKNHKELSKLGPNDGLTTLVDELTDNGVVITELGLDHYYKDPNIDRKTIALLYTAFTLIDSVPLSEMK